MDYPNGKMDVDRCRKLSAAFYARVDHDPILRAVYPPSHRCAIEWLALFLAQFLGGPCDYAQQRWSLSLREAHFRFKIGRKERHAWVRNMGRALDDMHIEEPARSGNVPIGEALLECGANLEARDKFGHTPLRRAVNWGKTAMVAFLLSRGADVTSKGSKGLTPWQAARGGAMKKLFQGLAANKRE